MSVLGAMLIATLVVTVFHLLINSYIIVKPKITNNQKAKMTAMLATLDKQSLLALANSIPNK